MRTAWALCFAAVLALAFEGMGPRGADAGVDVDVHIGVPVAPAPPPPPPLYVVPQPEALVFVPRLGVYFAPGLSLDLFFTGGYWWSVQDGHWRRARDYGGPWTVVERRRVPRAVLALPPDYRRVYRHYHSIPYGQWKQRHEHREHRGHREVRGAWEDGHEGKHGGGKHKGEFKAEKFKGEKQKEKKHGEKHGKGEHD